MGKRKKRRPRMARKKKLAARIFAREVMLFQIAVAKSASSKATLRRAEQNPPAIMYGFFWLALSSLYASNHHHLSARRHRINVIGAVSDIIGLPSTHRRLRALESA